jgi:zinc transporter ZupT
MKEQAADNSLEQEKLLESETVELEAKNEGDEHPEKLVVTTTTGLVVHSLAEGVAMGASMYMTFSDRASSMGAMVIFAIFIHKMPEAIGFGTFLTHKNVSSK